MTNELRSFLGQIKKECLAINDCEADQCRFFNLRNCVAKEFIECLTGYEKCPNKWEIGEITERLKDAID